MYWREQLALGRSLLIILFSTVLVSGSAALILLYRQHVAATRMRSPSFQVQVLVQTSSRKEALPSLYLEELLQLSQDRPTGLYQIDPATAEQRLKASPLIAEAHVRQLPPHTLFIDYDLREPVAYLADFTEVALDSKGVVIPVRPFRTPKQLPEIYLGDQDKITPWGQPIDSPRLTEALRLLNYLTDEEPIPHISIKRIDVSDGWAPYGRRQLLLLLEDQLTHVPQWLRLDPTRLETGWANYRLLRPRLLREIATQPGTYLIDLRLPHIAFWKREPA